MKLLLDMNLSPRLAPVLERYGHECTHWSSVGPPTADDEAIFKWASENGHVVVTHDLDFGAILAFARAKSPSVIQIRTQDVLSRTFETLLARILDEFEKEIEAGALIVAYADRFRVRILPLTR